MSLSLHFGVVAGNNSEGHLTTALLELEDASGASRRDVREWLRTSINLVVDSPFPSPEGLQERTSRFLNWLEGLAASDRSADWKLSGLARGEKASCLGLACAAVIVGRSAGLQVNPVAVPDHLLLEVEVGGRPRLLELLEHGREIPWREAEGRYRVPATGRAFLRPLTDRELLACVHLERGAERLTSGDRRGAARDFRMLIRFFSEHPSGHYNLGLVEEGRGRWKRAESLFSRGIALNSLDARPWEHRAFIRAKLCRREAAAGDLDEALRLDPQMAAAGDLRRLIALGCP